MSADKSNNPPFWVWMVVLGTLSIGLSLAIEKSDIGEAPNVDAVVSSGARKPEATDYTAFYSQEVTYQCGNTKSVFTAVSTQYSVAVLMVDQSDGHIYNIAAFNQKRGNCVPLSIGKRIVSNGVVNDYYNRMINRLYPNNVR